MSGECFDCGHAICCCEDAAPESQGEGVGQSALVTLPGAATPMNHAVAATFDEQSDPRAMLAFIRMVFRSPVSGNPPVKAAPAPAASGPTDLAPSVPNGGDSGQPQPANAGATPMVKGAT